MMIGKVLVLGYGAVGKATVEKLLTEGHAVQVAQRKRPADLPAGVGFTSVDVLDATQVNAVIKNMDQVVVALGFEYNSKLWKNVWPRAMHNLLDACALHGTRMVFIDNLYMYGEQDEALREDMPLTSKLIKPAVRAEITRMWMEASRAGKVKVAALRASDFYGPGVLLSQFGETGFGALAKHKAAQLIIAPDLQHDFTYVPDIARAALSLLEAPDADYGQAWHVPNAPTRTPREIIAMAAASLNVAPKLSTIPKALLPIIGLFVPILREFKEMSHQNYRTYRVDTSKFAKRFWSDATPFEVGVPAAAKSFGSSNLS
jgi:nucleoside-diphosphate-sugar epimerase